MTREKNVARKEWPLGAYIREHRGTMSIRGAARRAGISETWWRKAEAGTQDVGGHEVAITVKPETLAQITEAIGADLATALKLAGYNPDDYKWLIEGPSQPEGYSEEDHRAWFAGLPREEREEVLSELQKLHVDTELKRTRRRVG